MLKKGKIAEVFFSVQGEGVYLGTPHVFIRFFGCNIQCRYCDTQLEAFKEYSAAQLKQITDRLIKKHNARYISLTGGEPLLQAAFIRIFLKANKFKKAFIFLETNGILYHNFNEIKNYVDIVAMDFKLPSSTKTGSFWLEHENFLNLCQGKEVFVKAVITMSTTSRDLKKAAALIRKINKKIPLVLQPDYKEISTGIVRKLINFQKTVLDYISDVRVIPQTHKILGVR